MDVNTISRVSRGFAQYAMQARNTNNAKASAQNQTTQTQSDLAKFGAATEVDISDAAKKAQQTPKQEDLSVEDEGAKTKGLSAEQVDALKEDLEVQDNTFYQVMMQAITEQNDKLQGWLDEGVGFLNLGGTLVEASRWGLPEVATNPEDAAKAIAPGGEWSVDAVSSRIFDLASTIAGNDPERLAQMKAAVEEGFKQAGVAWNKMTGQDDMPEITKQTYNEIMNRFDKRTNELNGTTTLE